MLGHGVNLDRVGWGGVGGIAFVVSEVLLILEKRQMSQC